MELVLSLTLLVLLGVSSSLPIGPSSSISLLTSNTENLQPPLWKRGIEKDIQEGKSTAELLPQTYKRRSSLGSNIQVIRVMRQYYYF